MNCSEIQNLISAYYDDELSAELGANVDAHLQNCSSCAAELAGFKHLSSLAAGLGTPVAPTAIWSAVAQELDKNQPEQRVVARSVSMSRHALFKYAAALAATVLIGFVGFQLFFHGDHNHEGMTKAMEQVASDLDADGATTLLLNKFGGSEVSANEAIRQVGYQPIASRGLPAGYSVEGMQVLNMPCCKCTQTACKRPDNTRFFIYEHDNEDTGWFEHQIKRQSECCGKTCQIVELNSRLAVTWQKGNRHITLLGVRDEEEIELLVSRFEENS
ncbi:MAG: anti-sigma factor RsiW [Mariniblastus sp.]|jgi:anti-sigma factor RsiW